VIIVHRLRGEPMFLNTDLIESIEATPDTVVTLVDGRKFVVAESPEEVVQRTLGFRASVLAAAEELRTKPSAVVVPLRVERSHVREVVNDVPDDEAPESGDWRNHR
jgi:flagellar protein FlbD